MGIYHHALAAGLIFAQACLVFYNVWLPVGIHMAIHLASRLPGTVGLAENNALSLITQVNGPVLLVPTRSGGASFFELIGFGIVALFLWQLKKRMNPKTSWHTHPAPSIPHPRLTTHHSLIFSSSSS